MSSSPLIVCPQQIRSKDYCNISRCHFVQILMLSQFREELDQIPGNIQYIHK